jgi:hypothetical protein
VLTSEHLCHGVRLAACKVPSLLGRTRDAVADEPLDLPDSKLPEWPAPIWQNGSGAWPAYTEVSRAGVQKHRSGLQFNNSTLRSSTCSCSNYMKAPASARVWCAVLPQAFRSSATKSLLLLTSLSWLAVLSQAFCIHDKRIF